MSNRSYRLYITLIASTVLTAAGCGNAEVRASTGSESVDTAGSSDTQMQSRAVPAETVGLIGGVDIAPDGASVAVTSDPAHLAASRESAPGTSVRSGVSENPERSVNATQNTMSSTSGATAASGPDRYDSPEAHTLSAAENETASTSPPGRLDCGEVWVLHEDQRDALPAALEANQHETVPIETTLQSVTGNDSVPAARPGRRSDPALTAPRDASDTTIDSPVVGDMSDCPGGVPAITGGPGELSDVVAERHDVVMSCDLMIQALADHTGRSAGVYAIEPDVSLDHCWEVASSMITELLIDAGLPAEQALCAAPAYMQAYSLILEGSTAGSFDNDLLSRLRAAETIMRDTCGLDDADFAAIGTITIDVGLLG